MRGRARGGGRKERKLSKEERDVQKELKGERVNEQINRKRGDSHVILPVVYSGHSAYSDANQSNHGNVHDILMEGSLK